MQEALAPHIQRRGARGTLYLRRRIPTDVLPTYPHGRKEIWVSLRTTDLRQAMTRLHAEQVRLEGEFLQRRLRMASEGNLLPSRQAISSLSEEQIAALGQQWLHQTLASDAMEREHGLSDGYFDDLSEILEESRRKFGQMLAKGQWQPMVDVVREWLPMIGMSADLSPEAERKVAMAMIKAQVTALDYRLARHAGDVVETADKAPAPAKHPARMAPVEDVTWEKVFEAWATRVANRPLSTKKHFGSHWSMLRRFATARGIAGPAHVTPKDMTDWVTDMAKSVTVVTVNTRLANVKTIFKTAHPQQPGTATHRIARANIPATTWRVSAAFCRQMPMAAGAVCTTAAGSPKRPAGRTHGDPGGISTSSTAVMTAVLLRRRFGIQALYAIETDVRGQPPDIRRQHRRARRAAAC